MTKGHFHETKIETNYGSVFSNGIFYQGTIKKGNLPHHITIF